jgi:mannose-6-phosphate isomerase-like protein (cupin superfamily)
MIVGTPREIAGETRTGSHGGVGAYFVRTLLDAVPGSPFRYVRDLTLEPGATIGDHLHQGDDEVYFVVKGTGVAAVDGEERLLEAGAAILTRSGSRHSLHNTGSEPLRIFVACAWAFPQDRAADR